MRLMLPRHFSLITASPPCTDFSQAKTTGQRDIEYALSLVQRTLEIISYFQPDHWWVETPRYGLLAKHQLMSAYPKWDVDYCQFSLFQKSHKVFWQFASFLASRKVVWRIKLPKSWGWSKTFATFGGTLGCSNKEADLSHPQTRGGNRQWVCVGTRKNPSPEEKGHFPTPNTSKYPPVGTRRERGGSPRRIGRIRSPRFFSS